MFSFYFIVKWIFSRDNFDKSSVPGRELAIQTFPASLENKHHKNLKNISVYIYFLKLNSTFTVHTFIYDIKMMILTDSLFMCTLTVQKNLSRNTTREGGEGW